MDELLGPGMCMILVCFKNAMTHLTVVCTAYTEENKGVTMTPKKEVYFVSNSDHEIPSISKLLNINYNSNVVGYILQIGWQSGSPKFETLARDISGTV